MVVVSTCLNIYPTLTVYLKEFAGPSKSATEYQELVNLAVNPVKYACDILIHECDTLYRVSANKRL